MAEPPVRVLYVGGMPRSGSTLLDLMLGQLPGHCDVGELFYLWSGGADRDEICACERPFSECPFWSDVGEVAFGGWDQVDVADVLHMQEEVDATTWLPLILSPRQPAIFRRRLDAYTEIMVRLYRAIAEVSGSSTVVDSTKRPSLAYILERSSDVDLRLVHVVRDPRAVVHAWTKKVRVPEGSAPRSHLKQRSPVQITRRWLTVNAMIAGLERRGVPRVVIRYEDLVTDARAQLERVLALGDDAVADADDPLSFIDGTHLQLAPSHTVAGGRIRFKRGAIDLRLDEAWRDDMDDGLRRTVGVLTAPLARGYGYT